MKMRWMTRNGRCASVSDCPLGDLPVAFGCKKG